MLALLCTAPQLSADDALPDTPSVSSTASSSDSCHLDVGSGTGSGSGTDLPTSSPSPSPRKVRRPRMATLASVSATFSNVKGSLLRRDSLGRPRIASESVPSGKAAKQAKHPRVQIGTPSAFKHHFHLGSDSRTASGEWDEERWRQVIEMRMTEIEGENIPVIEVTTSSTPNTPVRPQPLPRRSTSSGRLAIDATMAALLANAGKNSDEIGKEKRKMDEARNEVPDGVVDPAKAAKTAKRASLVKRKPVPPLYPEPLPALQALMPPRAGSSAAGDSVDCAVPLPASSSATAAPAVSTTPASAPAPVLAPLHISVPRSMSPPVVPPRRHTPVNALTRVAASSSSSSATLTIDASLVSSTDLDPGPDPASALAPPPACVPEVKGAAEEADASPRPSISSLMTTESSASAASAASETSAESAAPRTPTEDREGAFGPSEEERKAGRTRRTDAEKDAETESVYETADDGDGEGQTRVGLRRLRSRRARVDFRAVEVGARTEARRDERVS